MFFYLEDRERTLDSPTDKIMLSLTAFADELEREKARQRTYDAMSRKAKAGHVTGGRVFGYDNVEIASPNGERSHVVRRIDEDQAAVIRTIFEYYAAGSGYRSIAKRLNDEGRPGPRPQQGRAAGWTPSTVWEALHRPIYRGEIVWNKTQKRNRWGVTAPTARAESTRVVGDLILPNDRRRDEVARRLARARHRSTPATGGSRQRLVTDTFRVGGADPKSVAHDDAGRDDGNVRIGHRVGQDGPRQRPRLELRHDIAAMATRQDRVVDDRESSSTAGWFVIHRARGDEVVPAPAQVVGHEARCLRLAQRPERVLA